MRNPALFPQPETSGTALITYALAAGIRAGILDPATYLPAVGLALQGQSTVALQPNGFLTNCQAQARRVIDGDVTTRCSAPGFPQSVTVDLGANRQLGGAMVVPSQGRAYRYRIETSTDNARWRVVIDRVSNTTGGSRLDDFSTGTVNARFVKLTVTSVFGVSTSWVSIHEFAVYPPPVR